MSREFTLSFKAANGYALLLMAPLIALLVIPYGLFYGWQVMAVDIFRFVADVPLFIGSIIAGTVAHELIHALCWSLLDGIPWKRISFGFKWKSLTPYVHCPDPVGIRNYRWGVAMPGMVLGLFPYLLALMFQNGWLFGFGLFFTLAAAGDMLILWLIRNVDTDSEVQDHPDRIGCRVLKSMEAR